MIQEFLYLDPTTSDVPMPIISLQISVERVENAIAALDIVKGEKS